MIDFDKYKNRINTKATQSGIDQERIIPLIEYARNLNDKNLPIIYDQQHLALLMGKDYGYLLGVSNSTRSNYKTYKLPKRRGGFRVIMEPFPTLKACQLWILINILYPIKKNFVAKNAKAYIPGKSIKDNVRLHCNKKLVLNIDLKDFFGTISFKMVLNFFLSLGYAKAVAIMLSNLCTCCGCLPQGAPTSPMLSNMVFKPVDDYIFAYCYRHNILFTRYADDMTFSGDFNTQKLLYYLHETLFIYGFRINLKKTRIYFQNQRQLVTNIVVNQKPHVRKSSLKRLRQEAYYISKYGICHHLEQNKYSFTPDYYLKNILGRINYALFINPNDNQMKKAKIQIYEEIKRFGDIIEPTVDHPEINQNLPFS